MLFKSLVDGPNSLESKGALKISVENLFMKGLYNNSLTKIISSLVGALPIIGKRARSQIYFGQVKTWCFNLFSNMIDVQVKWAMQKNVFWGYIGGYTYTEQLYRDQNQPLCECCSQATRIQRNVTSDFFSAQVSIPEHIIWEYLRCIYDPKVSGTFWVGKLVSFAS